MSVRYFFRLVVEDGNEECKWNTTEVVLFRAKAPQNSANMSVIGGGSVGGTETDDGSSIPHYEVTGV